jgi:S-DNA-T family DNA segregation ATPase FtsK/SpoIIIE
VGAAKPVRIQGTYVKDSEIERVIDEIKSYADARYDEDMIAETDRRAVAAENGGKEVSGGSDTEEDGQDPMLRAAIETVVDAGMASTSLLQRKLKLGYARAARIMDEMESLHVIGPYEGSKPRQVLITRDQFLEMSTNGRVE